MNQFSKRLNRLDRGCDIDPFADLTDEQLIQRIEETNRKLVEGGVPQSLIDDVHEALSNGVNAIEAFKPIKEFVEKMEAQR